MKKTTHANTTLSGGDFVVESISTRAFDLSLTQHFLTNFFEQDVAPKYAGFLHGIFQNLTQIQNFD